jgi:hypothetical protein
MTAGDLRLNRHENDEQNQKNVNEGRDVDGGLNGTAGAKHRRIFSEVNDVRCGKRGAQRGNGARRATPPAAVPKMHCARACELSDFDPDRVKKFLCGGGGDA